MTGVLHFGWTMPASLQALLRTVGAMPLAAAVTLALFVLMKGLIAVDAPQTVQPAAPPEIQILAPIVVENPPGPRPRPELVDPPTLPDIITIEPGPRPSGRPGINVARPQIETPHLVDISSAVPDRPNPQPTVRIPPQYPPAMESRGQEGSCTVTFDVLATGVTANVRASCSAAGFVRAAERSVRGWRYQPAVRAGEPVLYRGLVEPIEFVFTD